MIAVSFADYKKKLSPIMQDFCSQIPNLHIHSSYFCDKNPVFPIDNLKDKINCGYYPGKDKFYIVDYIPVSIDHEISHMIEFSSQERLLKPDFGFMTFDESRKMVLSTEKQKGSAIFAAFGRELRVRIIQSKIGYYTLEDMKTGMFFNKKAFWIPSLVRALPFGKFSSEKEVHDWVDYCFDAGVKTWTMEKIRDKFKKNIEFIKDWVETKDVQL